MDIMTGILIFIAIIFGTAIVSLIINNRKKSKRKTCILCNGMGFTMEVNQYAPPCTSCNGTGYCD